MKITPWGIAIIAVAFAVVSANVARLQYRRAAAFEQKAELALGHQHVAEIEVGLRDDKIRELKHDLSKRHAATAVLTDAVVAADLQSNPDSSCAPSIDARNAVIESQRGEIDALHGIIAEQDSSISVLRASNNELASALRARPKLYPRFVGPNIGLGVSVGVVGVKSNGQPALGVSVGVNVNVFSVRF